jgi:hypothetical protein
MEFGGLDDELSDEEDEFDLTYSSGPGRTPTAAFTGCEQGA